MDYEKAYNEAIKRAKAIIDVAEKEEEVYKSAITIFPELRESEDEKIRKALISFLKSPFVNENITDEKVAPWLAWLENQKEYESTDFEYVWDRTDCGDLTSALDKYSEEAIINMCHAWYDKGIELERKSWLEKQCYTKKDVDDAYLKGICNTKHELEKQDEKKSQRMVSAEAKEALYDKPTDEEMKELLRTEYEKGKADTIAEMEKDWSEEDEEIINGITSYLCTHDSCELDGFNKWYDWLKSLKDRVIPKPKQEWVEEDEKRLKSCLNILQPKTLLGNVETINTKWLKSLKDRVQPQPKPAWSLEDERVIAIINNALTESNTPPDDYDKVYDWLESIKQRIGG